MPQVLDDVTAHASTYANPRREETMTPPKKQAIISTDHKDESESNWPMFILTTGGSATGAAFLGGALLGGPAGAVGGTVVGIILGLFLHTFKK